MHGDKIQKKIASMFQRRLDFTFTACSSEKFNRDQYGDKVLWHDGGKNESGHRYTDWKNI
jgi:hypothetical protein